MTEEKFRMLYDGKYEIPTDLKVGDVYKLPNGIDIQIQEIKPDGNYVCTEKPQIIISQTKQMSPFEYVISIMSPDDLQKKIEDAKNGASNYIFVPRVGINNIIVTKSSMSVRIFEEHYISKMRIYVEDTDRDCDLLVSEGLFWRFIGEIKYNFPEWNPYIDKNMKIIEGLRFSLDNREYKGDGEKRFKIVINIDRMYEKFKEKKEWLKRIIENPDILDIEKEESKVESIEEKIQRFRYNFKEGLRYRTKSGLYVRSRAERTIANFLWDNGILAEFEPSLLLEDNVFFPDFYIPEINTYIEYFGRADDEYMKKRKFKYDTYKTHIIKCISIDESDIDHIYDKLKIELNKSGINKVNWK